eukprot:jgi/Phyca11/101354/e_gw1.5.843.1
MRFYYVVLVVVATLFTSANALTIPVGTKLRSHLDYSSVGQNQVETRRPLRVVSKNDKPTSEERGITIPTKVKLFWWLEVKNKPNSYVKTKLGLDKLDDIALQQHKNYPLYLKYMDKREYYQLWELARNKYSTYKFWQERGLDKMITLRRGMTYDDIAAEIKKLEGTEPFRVYKRYAKEFDQHRLSNFHSGYYRDTKFIDENASAVEKYVRAQFWAEAEIDKRYVQKFLGMKWAKPEEVNQNTYYQYYLKMSNQSP